MEVTKWLKPSDSGSRIGDRASVQAASLEKDDAQADPMTLSGKADTADERDVETESEGVRNDV
jgi:hypothetical protein